MANFSNFTSDILYSGTTNKLVPKISSSLNNTDVIAPDFRLYIEGVQVPFQSISINQVYNKLPTADLQIPPESGLLDIIRGYEPKVHIFYKDDNYGGYRLLFWGVIKSNSYSRSRGQGNASIVFHCEHKNSVLNQVTLSFAGWANPNTESLTNPNPNNAATFTSFNSLLMLIKALQGITGVADTANLLNSSNSNIDSALTNLLDPKLTKILPRLQGMPGVIVNLWNQLKKNAYANKLDTIALTGMYFPLIEEGIGFFKRLSGHTFLEAPLQANTYNYCPTGSNEQSKIILPPSFRNNLFSSVQTDLMVKNMNSLIGFSGELTSFQTMTENLLNYSKYDFLTLASPAEINLDPEVFIDDITPSGIEKVTVETIFKPQIPFYYSPICNVILPRMYSSINITQDESTVPSRLTALHDVLPEAGRGINQSFNGPASIREAIAYNSLLVNPNTNKDLTLDSTLGNSYHIPGKFEQGRGIRPERIILPWWLSQVSAEKASGDPINSQEQMPEKGTAEYNNLIFSAADWRNRYAVTTEQDDGSISIISDPKKNNLNPNDPLNTSVKPHERILFNTIDYEFSEKIAGSRLGFIEGIFNPYIIPGYPMDVIDESPNHPSFHGFCTSVVHTITSSSVTTNISMAAAVSYAELSNYYLPPLPPFLQTQLQVVNGTINQSKYSSSPAGDCSPVSTTMSTLLQNPIAKDRADTFYKQVLGVGAVAPDDLIHFASGRAYPLRRLNGIFIPQVVSGSNAQPNIKRGVKLARELEDYYSTVGNLRLIARPIESIDSIKTKFKYYFIDLTPELYNTSYVHYINPLLAKDLFMEPGSSLFLDYMETNEFINVVKGR